MKYLPMFLLLYTNVAFATMTHDEFISTYYPNEDFVTKFVDTVHSLALEGKYIVVDSNIKAVFNKVSIKGFYNKPVYPSNGECLTDFERGFYSCPMESYSLKYGSVTSKVQDEDIVLLYQLKAILGDEVDNFLLAVAVAMSDDRIEINNFGSLAFTSTGSVSFLNSPEITNFDRDIEIGEDVCQPGELPFTRPAYWPKGWKAINGCILLDEETKKPFLPDWWIKKNSTQCSQYNFQAVFVRKLGNDKGYRIECASFGSKIDGELVPFLNPELPGGIQP